MLLCQPSKYKLRLRRRKCDEWREVSRRRTARLEEMQETLRTQRVECIVKACIRSHFLTRRGATGALREVSPNNHSQRKRLTACCRKSFRAYFGRPSWLRPAASPPCCVDGRSRLGRVHPQPWPLPLGRLALRSLAPALRHIACVVAPCLAGPRSRVPACGCGRRSAYRNRLPFSMVTATGFEPVTYGL